MASIDELIRKLEQFQTELQNRMPAISKEIAGNFVLEKVVQIRNKGVGTYKTNKYPAYLLKGKTLTASGKSFIDQKIKSRELTNWSELRKAQGMQIRFVDLSYSLQMLGSTGLTKFVASGNRYKVEIGGRNDEAKKKLQSNFERYGDFLKPTPEQAERMEQALQEKVLEIFKRIVN